MSEYPEGVHRRQMHRVVAVTDQQAGLCQHCREPYRPGVGEALCRDCIKAIAHCPDDFLMWWFDRWLGSTGLVDAS